MYPKINFFNFSIATYGLFILIGVALGVLLATYLGKKCGVLSDDVFNGAVYGVLGMGVGGKLLYLITDFSNVVKGIQNAASFQDILVFLTGGFVFYGGFIGGIIMIYVYCKRYQCSVSKMFSVLIPAVPLVHALGRVGCFFAGCCYGIPYAGVGSVLFTQALGAPNGVALFPVQLLEMLVNFIICFILLFGFFRKISAMKLMSLYLILYSIMRFSLEFLRGDIIRGIYFGLSTSQWISLLLLGIGLIGFIKFHLDSRENNKAV